MSDLSCNNFMPCRGGEWNEPPICDHGTVLCERCIEAAARSLPLRRLAWFRLKRWFHRTRGGNV